MEKYADTPMDFADACVTRLAELHDTASVITTDTDFLIYRKSNGSPLPLIAPFVPMV
jgi:predicted nucleic acid-binding protein